MADIERYRRMLAVNKRALDDELELQSELQEEIGRELSRRNSAMLEAKDDLARVEARLQFQVREERGTKLTKDEAEALIVRHRDRIAAWKAYQEAREQHEQWEVLYRAWIGRGFSMEHLTSLYHSQYFAKDSTGFTDRDKVRAARDADARAMMRAASEASSALGTISDAILGRDGRSNQRRKVED